MKFLKLIITALICFGSHSLFSQNTFKATVKDSDTKETLPGVSAIIQSTVIGVSSDMEGNVLIPNIPAGRHTFVFSMIGYAEQRLSLSFPLPTDTVFLVLLSSSVNELGEVVVSSTRSSRTISNIPTRIETIAAEELEEKAVMKPSNIRMMLAESTGIQVQQTSQVSGSASIRIQGLDGKYTQLLQDGFPLYSGYAEGLSLLQIPPLNLKRVEIIKGSSSTLYGGGAIAGLINLITKEPAEEEREISTLFNMNTSSALDVSAFYSEKYGKTGLTFYTAGNFQKEYDVNNNGYSDIPRFKRFTVNPNFYYYFDKNTTLNVGLNVGVENRKGGDMQVIKGNADNEHIYYEQNNTNRYSATAKFSKKYADKSTLTVKAASGYFKRLIERHDYNFDGGQFSGFVEGSYFIQKELTDWVFGLNAQTDDFKQSGENLLYRLNYINTAFGLFAQNTWNITPKFITETGLRFDYTNHNDFFALPRLSLLYKINPQWSSRIGGGLGYKMPTAFSEDSEEQAFRNILPLDFDVLKPERSYGVNADINFKTTLFDELFFSVNQMFFYTIIQKPLVLNEVETLGYYAFGNANGRIDTKGFETNVKLRYDDISCFLGYTFTDAVRKFDGTKTMNPLTTKHRINANLMYEIHDKLRIAYELFYISPQELSTGERVRGYWIMGVSAEYMIKNISLFINFENFTDTRQSRWGDMYTGDVQNPQFAEIYAPTDGFIANGGFRLRF